MNPKARYDGPHDWPGVDVAVRSRRLDAGEVLFRQGDQVASVYRVASGRIRLLRYLADGSATVMHVAQTGETFAEASVFADAYHCDAVADVASVIDWVPKRTFLAAIEGNSAAGLGFTHILAAQVRDLRALLELRDIRSARDRILGWLRLHASGDPPAVRMSRTWTDVANEIGLTREAIYRSLASLRLDGTIATRGRVVTLVRMGEDLRATMPRGHRGPGRA